MSTKKATIDDVLKALQETNTWIKEVAIPEFQLIHTKLGEVDAVKDKLTVLVDAYEKRAGGATSLPEGQAQQNLPSLGEPNLGQVHGSNELLDKILVTVGPTIAQGIMNDLTGGGGAMNKVMMDAMMRNFFEDMSFTRDLRTAMRTQLLKHGLIQALGDSSEVKPVASSGPTQSNTSHPE